MLMKARDDGGKPGTPPETAAQASGPGPSKIEREGQRPTQPVYQIQNRGMGASASSSAVDRELSLLSFILLIFPTVGVRNTPDSSITVILHSHRPECDISYLYI